MSQTLHPEALLFSTIIKTKQMSPVLEAGITSAHFTAHPEGWAFLVAYWTEYNEVPSRPLFAARFKHITLSRADDLSYAISNLLTHARTSQLRKGIKEAHGILSAGDIEGATGLLQQHLRDASEQHSSATVNLSEVTDDLFRHVSDRHERVQAGEEPGIPTGWYSVDTYTGGVQKGHLWVLGARLGQGKTWHMVNMAANAIKDGRRVLFVSMEMPYREVAYRLHGLLARSFGYDVRSFSLSSGKGVDLMAYKQFLLDMPDLVPGEFIVNDTRRGRMNPMSLGAQIEQCEPDITFVDYLTLLGSSDGKRASDDWRVAAQISNDVKDVAQRTDTPIVAAAQLNRTASGGTKHPGVDTLSQSDVIGMDADAVMTMATYGCAQVRRSEMVKFRHGPDGWSFFSRFDPDGAGFGELTRDEAQDVIDAHGEDDGFDFS